MLTPDNLAYKLAKGKPWPPEDEVGFMKRLTIYEENALLFAGKHDQVYKVLNSLYSTHEMEPRKVKLFLNWHKRLSTLWADMLLGEKPMLKAGKQDLTSDEPPIEDKYLISMISRVKLWRQGYALALDMSRFGVGIAKVYAEEGKPAKLQIISPKNWFPIIGLDGQPEAHMIAWMTEQYVNHVRVPILWVEIHSPGKILSCNYAISLSGKIASDARDKKEVPTEFDLPLVFPIINGYTSDNIYGTDDYQDIDTIIKRLEITFTRIGAILDRHSEPAFAVPEDAIGPKDPLTGEQNFNMNRKVFPLQKGDQPPQYITWDGQLAAAFNLIKDLMSQLYVMSETCAAAFLPDTIGRAISGKALRMLMVNPLKRVERMKLNFDPEVRQIIRAISYLDVAAKVEGAVKLDQFQITWYDGLPIDFSEDVTSVTQLKVANCITDERAQSILFRLDGKALIDEVNKLHAEVGI